MNRRVIMDGDDLTWESFDPAKATVEWILYYDDRQLHRWERVWRFILRLIGRDYEPRMLAFWGPK